MKTDKEYLSDAPSASEVKDVPEQFKQWVRDNSERIEAARQRGSEPYFVKDNEKTINSIFEEQNSSISLPQDATDLIEYLNKYGNLEEHYNGVMDEREIYRKWDLLTDEQRIEVIKRGKFSGMIASDDTLDFANLYQETSRTNMIGTLQDELTNLRDGYDVEDSNHYILKFKGNDNVVFSTDLTKPLTASQLKKLEFVSANYGLSNYRYWVADNAAKQRLIREMEFIEYRNGEIVSSWNGKDFFGEPLPPHYGNAMHLPIVSKNEMLALYKSNSTVSLDKLQRKNIADIATKNSLEVKPMTFKDADSGLANVVKDTNNCQTCVVVFEARRRGIDVTALSWSSNPKSSSYILGERFEKAWINPKTGKTPIPSIIQGEDAYDRLVKQMEHKGRYIVGINTSTNGHVVYAERFADGKLAIYDPQRDKFVDISNIPELESYELLKIDKLLLNKSIFQGIFRLL